MKKIIIILSFIISNNVNAQWLWASSAGTAGMDYAGMDYGSSTISTDQLGNSYITGLFNGPTMTFSGGVTLTNTTGHPMVFVAKYNTLGICLWARQFGGNAMDTYGNKGEAIDIDNAGNCYATGTFHGSIGSVITVGGAITLTGTGHRQIFIVKYSTTGTALWAKQPTGNINVNHYGRSITTDFSGNSYITGYLGATGVQFGTTPALSNPGSFVAKYNSSGNVSWAKKIGNGSDNTWSVEIDPLNNTYVIGDFAISCTFPSGLLTSIGTQDVFVAKLNAAGTFQWVKQYGGTNNHAWGKGISTDSYGNIFLTGYFDKQMVFGSSTLAVAGMGQRETFVTKIDYFTPNNVLWAKQSTGSQSTLGNSIKASPNGDCYVAGHYSGMTSVNFNGSILPLLSNGQRYTFVVKFDSNGIGVWGERSGPASGFHESPMGISYDALYNIYIAGNVQGAAQFGTLPLLISYGQMNAFIAKLKYRCN